MSAVKPITMAQNIRPNSVTPRWQRCRASSLMRSCSRSIERPDALQVAEVHPHEERAADDVLVGHEAPVARILGIVAVVAHHEVVACGHLAGDRLGTVA